MMSKLIIVRKEYNKIDILQTIWTTITIKWKIFKRQYRGEYVDK